MSMLIVSALCLSIVDAHFDQEGTHVVFACAVLVHPWGYMQPMQLPLRLIKLLSLHSFSLF